jgi:5-deoxy-glucuronate isomerase
MARLQTSGPLHPWHIPAGTRPGAPGGSVLTSGVSGGSAPGGDRSLSLNPGDSVLQWSGLDIIELAAGESTLLLTGPYERALIPAWGAVTVEVDGKRFELRDRIHVFHSTSDWCYLPIDTEVKISSKTGAQIGLCSAKATKRFDPAFLAAESVPVELRGAGQASRQINNFMAPGVFDGAEHLMAVEVITPDGNWSSYPPHRHDGEGDCTVNNEEIYWFRIGGCGPVSPGAVKRSDSMPWGYSPDGFAMHRTYTVDGEVDVNVAVYDGDVFLIPKGYHGPCVAAPGYPLYYLNVLAGPSSDRSMAFCDDPTHHWVRDSWNTMTMDRRLPMTSASGPVQ